MRHSVLYCACTKSLAQIAVLLSTHHRLWPACYELLLTPRCFRFHTLHKSDVELHSGVSPENLGTNGTGRKDEVLRAEGGSEEAATAAASSCTILQQQSTVMNR